MSTITILVLHPLYVRQKIMNWTIMIAKNKNNKKLYNLTKEVTLVVPQTIGDTCSLGDVMGGLWHWNQA